MGTIKKSFYLAIAASLLISAGVTMADTINIAQSTPFSANANVPPKVKSECNLQTKLPGFIQTYAGKKGMEINLVAQPVSSGSAGRNLVLEISNVNAPGGGAWSGPKSVAVVGKLYQNGQLIGDFHGSRYTTGGAFGGFKGTCSLVGRCVKSLGKDISKWLKNPTKGASLGNG